MPTARFVYTLLIIWLLTGCDCIQRADGIVLDKLTGKPLAHVNISKAGTSQNGIYTDSNGIYHTHGISGGFSGCPDIELSFVKAGYKPMQKTFPSQSSGDTIWLELL